MISWIWLLQTFKQTPFAQLLPPKKLFVQFPKVIWLWMRTGCNISGERGQDGGDDDDDGDDDGDDDIYIMMKCLSVCHEKSSLPPESLL